jgi:hypothetical protein
MQRGYNLDRDRNTDTTAAREAKLEKSKDFQARIWQKIKQLVRRGDSLQEIVDYLNVEVCIPTTRGKKWDRTRVRRIIKKWGRSG